MAEIIKKELLKYCKSVANDTKDDELKKVNIPNIKRKIIPDTPTSALKTAEFLCLMISLSPKILSNDPQLEKLRPLHNTLKMVYETKKPNAVFEDDLTVYLYETKEGHKPTKRSQSKR